MALLDVTLAGSRMQVEESVLEELRQRFSASEITVHGPALPMTASLAGQALLAGKTVLSQGTTTAGPFAPVQQLEHAAQVTYAAAVEQWQKSPTGVNEDAMISAGQEAMKQAAPAAPESFTIRARPLRLIQQRIENAADSELFCWSLISAPQSARTIHEELAKRLKLASPQEAARVFAEMWKAATFHCNGATLTPPHNVDAYYEEPKAKRKKPEAPDTNVGSTGTLPAAAPDAAPTAASVAVADAPTGETGGVIPPSAPAVPGGGEASAPPGGVKTPLYDSVEVPLPLPMPAQKPQTQDLLLRPPPPTLPWAQPATAEEVAALRAEVQKLTSDLAALRADAARYARFMASAMRFFDAARDLSHGGVE